MVHAFTRQNQVQILKVDQLYNEFENNKLLGEIDEFILDGDTQFVVDLSGLKFMNSTGLNFLISVLTKSRNAGGDTVIVNISEQVQKLLVIMKLKEMFTVKNTVEEAVDFFKAVQN